MTELFRYQLPLGRHQLPRALDGSFPFPVDALGVEVDFAAFEERFIELADEGGDPAGWDRVLLVPLHKALTGKIDRKTALDPRFWHWVTTVPLSEFVWTRWSDGVPEDPSAILTDSLAGRFLGAATLHGMSRNALARLYWCAETLWTEEDGYELAQEALTNQDFYQAIFERELGLYPPAAIACLRVLKDRSEEQRREGVRRLNHYLTTVAVESLDISEVEALLAEG